jgi:dienelactone hydrolase
MHRSLILAAVLWCLLRALAVANVQPSAFADDKSVPLDLRIAHSSHSGGALVEDVSFASPFGRRIRAEVVRAAGAGSHPGVLFVHWLGDPKTTNLTEFEPDARALAARGVTSVLVDAMWAAPDWFDKVRRPDTDYVESIRQVVDLRRSLDVLEAQPGVDPNRIAYVGHDFGAMYGALLSAVDARPKWYVLMAGTTSFVDWYLLGTAPKDKAAYAAQMHRLDPPAYLARSSARHFLFQFALKDPYVPVAAAERFAAAAPGERGVFFYEADHSLDKPAIAADRRAWLIERLFGAASQP